MADVILTNKKGHPEEEVRANPSIKNSKIVIETSKQKITLPSTEYNRAIYADEIDIDPRIRREQEWRMGDTVKTKEIESEITEVSNGLSPYKQLVAKIIKEKNGARFKTIFDALAYDLGVLRDKESVEEEVKKTVKALGDQGVIEKRQVSAFTEPIYVEGERQLNDIAPSYGMEFITYETNKHITKNQIIRFLRKHGNSAQTQEITKRICTDLEWCTSTLLTYYINKLRDKGVVDKIGNMVRLKGDLAPINNKR